MSQHLFPTSMPDALGEPRKAALLLHSMPPGDRQWLLAQLPTAQGAALESLLREVEEIGLPSDPDLLREVLREAATPTPAQAQPGDPRAFLEHADPVALSIVLGDEPAGLIAQLLDLQNWTWEGALLERLSVLKRHQIAERRRLGRKRLGIESVCCLLEGVRARLALCPVASPATVPPRPSSGLARFLSFRRTASNGMGDR